MAPLPRLLAPLALLLPGGAWALSSLHLLPTAQKKAAKDNSSWVSPIAGCQGFDCILQYIQLPDDAYAWRDTQVRLRGRAGGNQHGLANITWTGYVLNMTSQRWRTGAHVSHPVWWHTLVVIIPDVVEFADWATLTLEFGINRPDGSMQFMFNREVHDVVEIFQESMVLNGATLPEHLADLKRALSQAAVLAARTRAPAASLLNLPNCEVFGDDPIRMDRSQDWLKAFSYADFLDHPEEPERIMEMPMAKAVVRAMDTVQAFTATLPTGAVRRFGVTGYSKLGTATYVAAAADRRVKAIAPMAIYLSFSQAAGDPDSTPEVPPPVRARELRALTEQFHPLSMPGAYGGVFVSEGTPESRKLLSIIDPAQFMERLELPKLLVWGANDIVVGMFRPQLPHLVPQLPGTTAFLEVPNCEHDAVFGRSVDTGAAFFRGVLLGLSPPAVESSWEPAARRISATLAFTGPPLRPLAVTRWERPIDSEVYTPKELSVESNGTWSSTSPSENVSAFVVFELEWPEPGHRYRVSTMEYP